MKKLPRLRNRNGRFLRKLRPTPEGELCWLIWLRRWHMWHRRAEDGSAAGYTREIGEAGLFPYSKALAYHDGDRNEAFHVSEKVDLFDYRADELQRLLGGLQAKAYAAHRVAA